MQISAKVILKRGKEQSLQRRHPWIFSGAIERIDGPAADGEWVQVESAFKKVLGYGHYQKGSISIRMLSFRDTAPGENFYVEQIAAALRLRLATGITSKQTNAFRLIHGEGDGLPGLVVDYYNGVAVIQAHSHGMHRDRTLIADAIQRAFHNNVTGIYYRSTLSSAEQPEYLLGMSAVPHVILEHGHKFNVDWEEGQKTGFFLDQRENRKLLSDFSQGKTVLNTFCYTGGFSVYALHAGATLVHSVDSSEKAMAMTKTNIELNGFDSKQHPCVTADAFDYLEANGREFDVIVLDPPAFAKHKDSKHQAMKGYKRLNTEAFKNIRPDGIVFTFSCSQVVDRQLFYDTIVSAAITAGREIRVLTHLGQPADHPVSIYHPEGEYLKGLVLSVT